MLFIISAPEDRSQGDVVIVSVDETSMEKLGALGIEWPWTRDLWAATVRYMQACGAKVLAFDMVFKERRNFDDQFGDALDKAKIPVVMGTAAQPGGKPDKFAPKVKKPPLFGAVNILTDKVSRSYKAEVNGMPSFAVRVADAAGVPRRSWENAPFLMHFFGPYQRRDGRTTFRYIPAYAVCKAAMMPKSAADVGISPDMFRGKIVLIGGTATGTFDLKSSPLSPLYPGVEIHATAIDDLLTGQIVQPASVIEASWMALVASFFAALGVMFPRRVTLKVLFALIAAALLAGTAVLLFTRQHIYWLPMASPLIAMLIATVGAFAWSYLTEDRQRRLVMKALSQYVSPEVGIGN